MSVYGLSLYSVAQRHTKEQKPNEDVKEFCFLLTPCHLFQLWLRRVVGPCVGGTGILKDAQGHGPFPVVFLAVLGPPHIGQSLAELKRLFLSPGGFAGQTEVVRKFFFIELKMNLGNVPKPGCPSESL